MPRLTLALGIALALAGCMNRPPRHDYSGEISYNRRDLPPEPGLFTGCDGVWTVYRNQPERLPERCPPQPGAQREKGAAADEAPPKGDAAPE